MNWYHKETLAAWNWPHFLVGASVPVIIGILGLASALNMSESQLQQKFEANGNDPQKLVQILEEENAKQQMNPEPVQPEPEEEMTDIDTRNLDGLEPEFESRVINILKILTEKGWRPRVAEGLRDLEQQKEKVRKGYSKTLNSKHLKGLAADIIDSRYGWGGEASDLDFEFWLDLGEAAKSQGLIWGGDWKKFKDVAHVEMEEPPG